MTLVATIARVLLGFIFLASGALKLRDESWPHGAAALGVPRPLIAAVAPFEIVLGALLVAGVLVTVMVVTAALLLGAFTAVLVASLRRPRDQRPSCACFGRWSARPIDRWSVLRNVVFLLLAVTALL